ncbi:MAG: 3-methylcrotonyl-CoA carboxylase [Gammaproteobacteria bacterium HGW-Gammaproteobacteria-4]|jgi:3-methylcrotonyl-CoA carboxylase alpha subunit|nr:MAG: 3-methylcrotonyl-CoA carboxylase [Gammaproteobacteria bacterium HGW-Gammaproteobacteria-4]
MFDTLLIANRGEIACRVIRSCRRLGVRTVAVFSEADAGAQHVRLADEAHCIGGPAPADSYLRGDAIIAVALQTGAQAIHPGYGFLSENADFAEAVERAGLVFVGPSAASMRTMGSKAGAKDLMHAAGVPVVPGYTGAEQSPEHLAQQAQRIGFPLMIKAAHGGGGKGMRIVRDAAQFAAALASCQREAQSAFGRDRMLLERYIEQPRHIEMQIFADSHGNAIHLGERECSAQRRYQKVLEESPSPFLDDTSRRRMGEAAVMAARAIDYRNAGTVEFIVNADGGFYFMEINTRLQVEHPVTEMVTGLDLVEWQLRVACGEPLPALSVASSGHAIEVRLYAEDPEREFLPGSGRLDTLRLPGTQPGVRVDSGVVQGDTVSVHYDPMIAKLIVHGADRSEALARMADALADCEVVGPSSNIAFLERLIRHPRVRDANIDTGYLDQHLDEVLPTPAPPSAMQLALCAGAALLADERLAMQQAHRSSEPDSPWAMADGWRLGHASYRILGLAHRGERYVLTCHGSAGSYAIEWAGTQCRIEAAQFAGHWLSARIDGVALRVRAHADSTAVFIHDGEHRLQLARVHPFHFDEDETLHTGNRVPAPMPGKLIVLRVAVGDAVEQGQEVAVMEAMKMELSLTAPRAGVVAEVRVAVGEFVDADVALIVLEVA